jgi:hypothetical protein
MVNPDRNLYDPPYDDALLYDTEMEPERPRSRSLIVMLAFVVLAADVTPNEALKKTLIDHVRT